MTPQLTPAEKPHSLMVAEKAHSLMVAEADRLLRAQLDQPPGFAAASDAWAGHRQAVFIGPGREGLGGGAATYHLEGAAKLIYEATDTLAGTGFERFIPQPRTRPRRALAVVAQAHGWRYLRGLEGVRDSFAEAGRPVQPGSSFEGRRQRFAQTFQTIASAAFLVNQDDGDSPLAVAPVIELFITELRELADELLNFGPCDGQRIGVLYLPTLTSAESTLREWVKHARKAGARSLKRGRV